MHWLYKAGASLQYTHSIVKLWNDWHNQQHDPAKKDIKFTCEYSLLRIPQRSQNWNSDQTVHNETFTNILNHNAD